MPITAMEIQHFEATVRKLQQQLQRSGLRPARILDNYPEQEVLYTEVAKAVKRPVIAAHFGEYLHSHKRTLWVGFESRSAKVIDELIQSSSGIIDDPIYSWDDSQVLIPEHQMAVLRLNGGLSYEQINGWQYFGKYFIDEAVDEVAYIRETAIFLSDVLESITLRKDEPTEYSSIIQARKGQGAFRSGLDSLWGGRCAVTGCSVREVLRASHMKAWKVASNKERLDPNNGLLLNAMLDALFDKGLISFDEAGQIVISNEMSASDRDTLMIQDRMALSKSLNQQQLHYLAIHRRDVFRSSI